MSGALENLGSALASEHAYLELLHEGQFSVEELLYTVALAEQSRVEA